MHGQNHIKVSQFIHSVIEEDSDILCGYNNDATLF